MSFVLQEFVHFVLPKILKGYGGSNAQQPIILVQPKTQFHVFGASVTNVTLVIIVAGLGAGPGSPTSSSTAPSSAAASARSPRTRPPPR